MTPRALACPASLKGCLAAAVAAERLAEGFERAGWRADRLAIADGGEGTVDVLCSEFRSYSTVDAFERTRSARTGLRPDGTRVVEAAEAIPLDPRRLDVMQATSLGLGLWIGQLDDGPLLVTVGGTATMDAGSGMLSVLDRLPGPTQVLCDVSTKLRDAPRLFGPQKGGTPEQVAELEERFRGVLEPWADLPGSGAAGGLGAALASLGAELVSGADAVLDLLDFEPCAYDVVVTGEGTVDATTWEGKAPSAVVRRCKEAAIRCVVFGGRVLEGDAIPLSGDPARAEDDLVELGERLGLGLRVKRA